MRKKHTGVSIRASKWSGKYAILRNNTGNKRYNLKSTYIGPSCGGPGSSLYGSDEHTYCSAVMRAKLLRFIFGGSRPDSGSKVFSTRGIIVNKTFAIVISLHLFCFFKRKCKAGN